jgi:putative SOS response-associated peptidase YedK
MPVSLIQTSKRFAFANKNAFRVLAEVGPSKIMCSNYEPIKLDRAKWVEDKLECHLPEEDWEAHVFKYYQAPFVYMENGITKCELGRFGLLPSWVKAEERKKYAQNTYNARTETIEIRDSYKSSWKKRNFGLVLAERFYEPFYNESGKHSKPTAIYRSDGEPIGIAAIWESFIDKASGEVIRSFSMLTVNASTHFLMSKFHKPKDEKRSIIVIENQDFAYWLNATHDEANQFIKLSPDGYLDADFSRPVTNQLSMFE